jgi:hypothetical protein
MQLSSDRCRSSSLGASSKTASMQPTRMQRTSRAVSPFNTSTIYATLAGSIVRLQQPFMHATVYVFVAPLASSFLVVGISPERVLGRA